MFFGILTAVMVSALFLLAPQQSFAQTTGTTEDASATGTITQGLNAAAGTTYSTELRLPNFVGNMIRTLLAATGIVFLIITVYAGILYMTATGDTDKIKKAKGMLTSSIIGLIIIVGAYAITSYVVTALSEAAVPTP